MSGNALFLDEQQALAAFGTFADRTVWYTSWSSDTTVHYSTECRMTVAVIPTPVRLGDLVAVTETGRAKICTVCADSAPQLTNQRTGHVDRAIQWLRAVDLRLRQTPDKVSHRLEHHRELRSLYRIADVLDPAPDTDQAVATATERLATALHRGRELGVERRVLWDSAAQAIQSALVARREKANQWLLAQTTLTAADLRVHEQYQHWKSQYGSPLCPVEPSELDTMAAHAFSTRCWARFNFHDLVYGASFTPAIFADVVFEADRKLVGRAPFLWANQGYDSTEVLALDNDYTLEEVRTAVAVDLCDDLECGVNVVRAANS